VKEEKRMTEYRMVVLGGMGVGKTSLIIQLCQQYFCEEYDPTLEDSFRKSVVIDNEPCLLDIWDTAWDLENEFPSVREQMWRRASGFLLVYSVTSRSSFEEIGGFIWSICRVKDEDEQNIPISICGNKYDLEEYRQVNEEEGRNLCEEFGWGFYETSAKLRVNIEESFYDLVRRIRVSDDFHAQKRITTDRRRCLIQ